MKLKICKRLVFISVLPFLLTSYIQAQTLKWFWINVTDNKNSASHTMIFGNHPNATNGFNGEHDSLSPAINEREAPPCGPDLCVVWRPPWQGVNWGGGFLTYDFRPADYYHLQDTFLLYFINHDTPDANIIITWPDSIYFNDRNVDRITLAEATGKIPPVNMLSKTSLTIPAAGDSGIYKVFIYKSSYGIIESENSDMIPSDYFLKQNYPNPFNPTTTIKYQLPFNNRVSLKVYNVLGQVIATLLNEEQQAGFKSVTWSADGVSSGVYFYKLEAVSVADPGKAFTQVKKMVLVR